MNTPYPEKSSREVPMISEVSSLGDIKINHNVVCSIVRLAATEVEGVLGVSGGLMDDIAGFFSDRRHTGVHVQENSAGQFLITLRLVMAYGVELARVAEEVQNAVSSQVNRTTGQEVARVDVFVDGVKLSTTKAGNGDSPPESSGGA